MRMDKRSICPVLPGRFEVDIIEEIPNSAEQGPEHPALADPAWGWAWPEGSLEMLPEYLGIFEAVCLCLVSVLAATQLWRNPKESKGCDPRNSSRWLRPRKGIMGAAKYSECLIRVIFHLKIQNRKYLGLNDTEYP